VQSQPVFLAGALQGGQEITAILVIAVNLTPLGAARRQVVDCPWKFDSKRSRHRHRSKLPPPPHQFSSVAPFQRFQRVDPFQRPPLPAHPAIFDSRRGHPAHDAQGSGVHEP